MSEIQDRVNKEKQMRHQLNNMIDHMENFLVDNDLESGEPSLEADINGAILTIPVAATKEDAGFMTDIFNAAHPYPLAQIKFNGILKDKDESQTIQ